MSLIKDFFKKELEDIIAPLDRIRNDIGNFIHRQEAEIEKDSNVIAQMLEKNKQRVEGNVKASTIIKNLETLLGVK